MAEIRPPTAGEMPEVARQAARQLGLSPSMFQGMQPEWALCAFEDGRVVTTYAYWPLQIRFNGPPAKISGVTWVSTHPAYRRRGNLRTITRQHFEQLHEEGETALAGLHPAWMGIYQRYGYGTVNIRHGYRIAPRDIVFAHPVEAPGQLREVDLGEEFGLLVDVYRRFREQRNGLVHRGRAMWDAGPLSGSPPGHQDLVIAYEEDDEPLGYVVYHHGPGLARDGAGVGQYLNVMDYFAITPAAHHALWGMLAAYDNVGEIRWNNAPADDPLPNMIVEPRLLNTHTRDGIMARLVTVEDAMTQRPYPELASLRFELRDEFCEWNDGRWLLDTDTEGSAMTRIDGENVDITLTADTLASMAFGRISASDAARAGLLEVHDDRALARWDSALRTKYVPYEAEHTW
ncbi:MAG: GNAT family N-acetyltransferase [Dehalococcoidia bacterium]|jgi:predicted acetyltransferase|nr:GNAT family N-acetyltransferase [Dehalococcoidia bacterium]